MTVERSKQINFTKAQSLGIAIATFGKWWNHLEPSHRFLIIVGIVLFLIGLVDLVRMLFGYLSLLFWTNDVFVAIGGIILIAAGTSYALRSNK